MISDLLDVLRDFVDSFFLWSIVDQYEQGVLLRRGRYRRTLKPGLHWRIPLIDKVLTDSVVQNTTVLEVQCLTTKDSVFVNLRLVVTHRIVNIRKALLKVEGVDSTLADSCIGITGQLVLRSTWDQVRSQHFARRIERLAKPVSMGMGMEIISVRVADLTRGRSLRLFTDKGVG